MLPSEDNISYCVVSISDRAKDNVKNTYNILHKFNKAESINFINANNYNVKEYINNRYGLNFDTWSPYDNRIVNDPLPGEMGVWASNLNIYDYIIKNDIKYFLIIEDDAILHKDFVKKFKKVTQELPKDFDFLSLYYFDNQNYISKDSDIGLKFLHKSINQFAGFQCILFSNSGIKKIIDNLQKTNITYTVDCYVYGMAQLGLLNGYSIKPNIISFCYENANYMSEIDPNNFRGND